MSSLIRDAGVWKENDPWVRDSGVWKPVQKGFVRDAGVWKEYYSLGFNPSTPLGTLVDGGYFFGILNIGGTDFALITSVVADAAPFPYPAWKTANTATSGTASNTDGLANSLAMNDASHPAAFYCLNLVSDGCSDFYLPARDEMKLLMDNRMSLPSGERPGAYHLSSTQSSTSRAVVVNVDGSFGTVQKITTGGRVCAIRRVPVA